jgi:hypothetical protein
MILNNLSVSAAEGTSKAWLTMHGAEFCCKLYKAKPEAHDLSGFYIDPGERMVMCSAHTYTEC